MSDDHRLTLLCPIALAGPVIERVSLPRCVAFDPRGPVDVHVVLQGGGRVDRSGAPSIDVGPGDVLIVRGVRERPANDDGLAATGESLRARYDGDRFAFDARRLPSSIVHVSAVDVDRDPSTASLVALLRRESGGVVAQRLFDALFAAIEKQHDEGTRVPLAHPLADARIERTIAELHARFADRWSVASMAKHAAMSRAAFARRFTDLTDLSPHAYLARLRIDVARTLLTTTDEPSTQIAVRVGYRSEHAFSRAFKRIAGEPPVVFRRARRVTACAA